MSDSMLQAKKSKENLKEITHKVYFDVEIDGKEAGMSMTFLTRVYSYDAYCYTCFLCYMLRLQKCFVILSCLGPYLSRENISRPIDNLFSRSYCHGSIWQDSPQNCRYP